MFVIPHTHLLFASLYDIVHSFWNGPVCIAGQVECDMCKDLAMDTECYMYIHVHVHT